MSEISEKLKARFLERCNGAMESFELDDIGKIYWKPLTGEQQSKISAAGNNDIVNGVLMYVKMRALDKNGVGIFAGVPLEDLRANFEYDVMTKIWVAMTESDLSFEDIEGN